MTRLLIIAISSTLLTGFVVGLPKEECPHGALYQPVPPGYSVSCL